jgi:hypothetical protein
MSYSSAPKPRPIGQLTPQQVLTALRQPSAIAVLASIAVHGALAVLLPMLPMQSEEPKRSRPVKVVTLTPAEQGRLGLGTGNGVGNGNGNGLGNGLRSSTPLPDLSFLQPSYPLYSIPPVEPPVEPLDPPPVEQDPQSSTTSSSRTTTQPKPKPSEKTTTGDGGGGQSANVCPTPPDDRPACKEKAAKEKAEAEARLKAEKEAKLKAKYASSRTKELTVDEFNTEYNQGWQPFIENAAALVGGKQEDVKELPNKGNVSDQLPPESCSVIQVALRAQVGAIIKPDGTFGDVVVLVSSGNQVLDAIAKAYVVEDIKKVAQSSAVKEIQAKDIKKRGKPSTVITIQYPFLFDPQISESCRSSPPAS